MQSPKEQLFQERTKNAGKITRLIATIVNFMVYELGGGKKSVKGSHVVNLACLISGVAAIVLAYLFQIDSLYSFTALGVFLSYQIVWPIKNQVFPDASWEHRMTVPSAIFFFCYLVISLSPGFFIAMNMRSGDLPLSENLWVVASIFVYVLGLLLLLISDCQKYFTLKYQKGLITTGMFKRMRHPNYLGQSLVYISFAMLAYHVIPLIWYVFVVSLINTNNIKVKEASMARYPEWSEYKKRSGYLFPKIF